MFASSPHVTKLSGVSNGNQTCFSHPLGFWYGHVNHKFFDFTMYMLPSLVTTSTSDWDGLKLMLTMPLSNRIWSTSISSVCSFPQNAVRHPDQPPTNKYSFLWLVRLTKVLMEEMLLMAVTKAWMTRFFSRMQAMSPVVVAA